MTAGEARHGVIERWLELSDDAWANSLLVKDIHPAGSVNRAYYACFYAASAVLLNEDREFVKHAGVRTAIHQHLIKTGRLSAELGKIYDDLMEARQTADYEAMIRCTPEDSNRAVASAQKFVAAMKQLLNPDSENK